MTSKITHNSLVSIGLVLTLSGVIFSAGILYNKVETNTTELKDFKKETKEQLTSLNEKIDTLVRIKIASFPVANSSGPKTE